MSWLDNNKTWSCTTTTLLEISALVSAGLFAGGACIISVAEHPARAKLGRRSALIDWKEAYERAAPWQAGHAAIAFFSGLTNAAAYPWMMVGSALVGFNIPYTFAFIMPINNALKKKAAKVMEEEEQEGEGEEEEIEIEEATKICFGTFSVKGLPSTRYLMNLWSKLHAVRAVMGTAGFIIMTTHVVMRHKKK